MNALTDKQKATYDFIKTYISEKGYPPSIKEIGKTFNVSPPAIFTRLTALEKKGYIQREIRTSRAIKILK